MTPSAVPADLKVFLDDDRPTPTGWVGVRWPAEAIGLLATGRVTHLSVDNDLGEVGLGAREGYQVLDWLEEAIATGQLATAPVVTVHSANWARRPAMERTAERIMERRLLGRHVDGERGPVDCPHATTAHDDDSDTSDR